MADLGSLSIRAGANYLSQSQVARNPSLAVPAVCGAAVVRPTDGGTEISVEAVEAEGAVTVLCLARSPAAPELFALAMASTSGGSVQVWQLPSRTSAATATATRLHKLEVKQAQACRQLAWHPHRRVLVALLPESTRLFELGGPAAREGPVSHELARPETCAGAMMACCWGESGSVLACLSEGDVLLYSWGLLGASWAHHTCARHPVPNRRLCAILPLSSSPPMLPTSAPSAADEEEEEDDDEVVADVFALGMGMPIATASAAEISSVEGSTRTLVAGDDPSGASRSAAPADEVDEVMDLRGRLGGGVGMSGRAGLLDLSAELEADRPTEALKQALGSHRASGDGALLLCRCAADGHVNLDGSPTTVATPQPDVLAHCATGRAVGLVVAGSSSSGRLVVMTCDLAVSTCTPLAVLELPDGFRTRGLTFDLASISPTLLALGGRRAQQSVLFSSPRAEQQLMLCTFGEAELGRAAAAAQPPPQGHSVSASLVNPLNPSDEPRHATSTAQPAPSNSSIPGTPMPPAEARSAAAGGATAAGVDTAAGSALGALLGGLQAHLDGRFAAIESAISRLDSRLGAVEERQARYTQGR